MIMRYVAVAARNIACWYAIYDMCCQWLCYLCTSRPVVHDLWGLMPVSVAWMQNVLDYSAICGHCSAWACSLCSISSPWSCDMLHLCFIDVYECRSYDMLLIIKRLRITAVRECHFCQGECTTQPSALKCRLVSIYYTRRLQLQVHHSSTWSWLLVTNAQLISIGIHVVGSCSYQWICSLHQC